MNVSVELNVEVIVEAGVVVGVSVDHQWEEELVDLLDRIEGREVGRGHSR